MFCVIISGMKQSEANKLLDDQKQLAYQEKRKLEKQIDALRKKYYSIKQELKGVMKVIDALEGKTTTNKISTKKKILEILGQYPEGMEVSEIVEEIEKQDNRKISKPSVASTLTRLRKDNIVINKDGKFILRNDAGD